jgi:UDP-2,3-diacylglucosamine hydrolase
MATEPPHLKKCCWLSDLHLFSRRSLGEQHFDVILAAARKTEVFVLGGDIFDFSWSTRTSVAASVDEAAVWLEELVLQAPDCRFYFLLGNHDYHRLFIDRLVSLEFDMPNLSWHPFFLRLQNTVFLHGDAADARTDAKRLSVRRSRWLNAEPKRPIWHHLYDLVVAARLHRLAGSLVYRDEWVARRLLRYLDEVGHGLKSGLEHVYFGHTHVPMSHYDYEGVKFHNGGAPLKGLAFQILQPILTKK